MESERAEKTVDQPSGAPAAAYEYHVVPVPGADGLQELLDLNAARGWRLAHTYLSMGYTTRLIFERKVNDVAT